jgi:hypothetical protein
MDRDRIWQWFYQSIPTDDEKEEMLGARFQAMFILHNYYGWRGLIFCFQKIVQSEIFQARFSAFKVLFASICFIQTVLYYQFWKLFVVLTKILKWYVTIQTLARPKALRYRVFERKFYPNVLPDFENNHFYTP